MYYFRQPRKFPTMQQSHVTGCTILLQNGAFRDICLGHCGICEIVLFGFQEAALVRLLHVWVAYFAVIELGVEEVCALGVLLVYYKIVLFGKLIYVFSFIEWFEIITCNDCVGGNQTLLSCYSKWPKKTRFYYLCQRSTAKRLLESDNRALDISALRKWTLSYIMRCT